MTSYKTRLLVSVRDIEEARIALDEGVDLIDLKEPNLGSLGRVAESVAAEVAALVAGRAPLSMALGELTDYFPTDKALAPVLSLAVIPNGVGFVKLGLAGCGPRRNWARGWQLLARQFPRAVERVFVAYADHAEAASPLSEQVIQEASRAEARAMLLDTATKDGRGLFDFWDVAALRRFTARVRQHGMLAVVGGGLTLDTIPQVAAAGADYVAVRGAACEGSRTGRVDAARIRAIRRILS
ncbi:MAG: hypothetical protein C0483_16660 [Pirellula sp.]|nr:hypothetical protein [Pirellula sp.]